MLVFMVESSDLIYTPCLYNVSRRHYERQQVLRKHGVPVEVLSNIYTYLSLLTNAVRSTFACIPLSIDRRALATPVPLHSLTTSSPIPVGPIEPGAASEW